MSEWRKVPPFNRRRKGKRRRGGGPSIESKSGQHRRRASDLPAYPSYRSTRRRKHPFRRLLKKLALYGFLLFIAAFGWFSYSLPDIDELNRFTKAPSVVIKSEDGQIIGSFGDVYGDYVPFEELPASLIDAVIATEDRNFYHHFGIDPLGIARAMIANIHAGQVVQGGSTITQQVAKNVFLTPERSLSRKIKEVILAFKLESRFSKQDIMSIYLNRVYLGAGNYGVDAASKRYFGTSARDISLTESAILAGLLKAPSRFAPTSNPQLSRQRAQQVLMNMQEAGFLTEQQTAKAKGELEKAMEARRQTMHSTYYFADWILDQLPEYIGAPQEDIVVISTLKPQWQALGEKAIAEVMDKESEKYSASQAALVAMTPDGAVRVMVGGRSYAESQFNRAAQSLRQPGSAFKLFVYLAGLEVGLTPDTLLDDEPVTVPIVGGKWSPKNYTGKYLGPVTAGQAVAESINTVAVQVAMEAGLNRVVHMARRLGITGDLLEVPSIALGATEVSLIELTTAYAHLAADGAIVYPYGILRIDSAKSRSEPLYERTASAGGRVLRQDVVHRMNEMLIGVVEEGTGAGARIGRPAAGKTGTTSDYRDAWFMGYTPDLAAGVWVGNDDNSAMKKVTGGMLPAMIWRGFMREALADVPARGIPTDAGVIPDLPWQTGTPEFPRQPDDRRRKDIELGPSFWDKLLR